MTPAAKRWLRIAIDYTGLAAFLITIAVTGNAILASWVVIGASVAALIAGFTLERRLAPIPLATAILGLVFGGATVIFHNEVIIKVKPTILYAGLGLFLLTGAVRGKNPLKTLMGDAFHLPDPVVRTLTLRYAAMFFALAVANEVIWRTQSVRIWGLFKVVGAPIAIFVFALAQAPLMMKHAPPEEGEASSD